MKQTKLQKISFISGTLVTVLSFSAAFTGIHNWHFPAAIGVWLMFDYLSSLMNNKTTLGICLKDKRAFLKIYLAMFLLGAAIEGVGRFALHWWTYPYIDSVMHEIVLLLFYPFILMSFREMYMLFSSIIHKRTAFLLSIAAGIVIWEIPNMFSMDWIYTVPYLHIEIFNLHILIILGWAALIGLPVYIYGILPQPKGGVSFGSRATRKACITNLKVGVLAFLSMIKSYNTLTNIPPE